MTKCMGCEIVFDVCEHERCKASKVLHLVGTCQIH